MNADTLTYKGREYRVQVERDENMGAPWDEHDGHGSVSGWTTRAKRPGELVLAKDGDSRHYYDFAESVRIARRDGWDAPPYKVGTKGEQAHRAALADFEHLRAWCLDEWYWVGVVVTDTVSGESASLWGIDGEDPYCEEVAQELAGDLHAERMNKARAKGRETRERNYWAARDVETRA